MKLINFWNDHYWEIMLFMAIGFIALSFIFKGKTNGQYSLFYFLRNGDTNTRSFSSNKIKSLPKESKGEKKCREILEEIFSKPFGKIRPKFLYNPVTKKNLELDCYNDDLKIALEYDGLFHFKYVPGIHRSLQDFQTQQYRDLMKNQLCRENGIKLIRVPYTIPYESLKDYIVQEIGKLHKENS